MNNDQISGDSNIDAEEMLRKGALIYAGETIATANGTPPGPDAPSALDAARRDIRPGNDMPTIVADALRNLQMAAVLFTLDLADGHVDPRALRHSEKELITILGRRKATCIVHVPDDAAVTLGLSDRALDYARQIIVAEESRAPIGSETIARALENFQLAAVAFTAQLATAEGFDPEIPRWVEKNLVAMLEEQERLS